MSIFLQPAMMTASHTIEDGKKLFAMGNERALEIMNELHEKGDDIAPDTEFAAFTLVCGLDTLKVYGPKLVKLHDEKCEGNLNLTAASLIAAREGFIGWQTLHNWMNGEGQGHDRFTARELLHAVRSVHPNFAKGEKGEDTPTSREIARKRIPNSRPRTGISFRM